MNDTPCKSYYQDQWSRYSAKLNPAATADECMHDFLDGKPAGKHGKRDRAAGLLSLDFWWQPGLLEQTQLARLVLAQILWVQDDIDRSLLDHLAQHNPDLLRWAIRYSKLFTKTDSQVMRHLGQTVTGHEWGAFLNACNRLVEQLEPFDDLIAQAEQHLKTLSLLELMSYLSILAYPALESVEQNTQQSWAVYERIIQRKLQRCSERDFQLTEKILGKSLKRHLSPLLFPGGGSPEKCIAHLESVAVLIAAMSERLDYEATIDSFCFDSDMHYQMEQGQPVIFSVSTESASRWKQTEEKSLLLWSYWLRRAMDDFVIAGMADVTIGTPENHEANQWAWIKAVRSRLVMQTLFGCSDKILLADGAEVDLHQTLLASELSSAFFVKSYLEVYKRNRSHAESTIAALGQMAWEGLLEGENGFPMTWSELPAKIKRIRGWTVSQANPTGDAVAAKNILEFWTVDLRQLSAQIKASPLVPVPRLSEQPFYKIGRYSFQFPWIAGQQNNLVSAVNSLRRIGVRRPELRSETEQVELCLAQALRQRGFKVIVGYQPPILDGNDAGEMDLICHLDGVVLLLEVKSGFIRSSRHEVWLHRTNTLRKAARQLRRKQQALQPLLNSDHTLRRDLNLQDANAALPIHAWVVDTSIECDGELLDGFRVVSREVMEVALKDQKHYLQPLDAEDDAEIQTLYPDGFSAQAFVDAVTNEAVWRGLLPK
ncbi:NERD domain-containing protein [Pseudomonas neustonica]|uniref:NERD domain-containing protein n=2 Tax=Pseudomonas TaxID=286 RepID=A0ABX9XKF4_9PSED|nr:NERD domain-containing protein [Pseudomonas sp. SSM44]ROZ84447.1 NERD domain-containing protein [Pseudomonas neustonica]